jgi:hypothetical protein
MELVMFSTPWRWLSNLISFLRGPGGKRDRPRPASLRPQVDALEDRLVCDVSQSFPDLGDAINPHLGSVDLGPSVDAILYTPMVIGDSLATHFHPHLTIMIGKKQQTIPTGIGILGAKGVLPIHTHDSSGILHVETIVPNMTFRLQDFFAIWGQDFTPTDILGHHADAHHKIVMTVNGVQSKAFGNLVLSPDQGPITNGNNQLLSNPPGIVITYETIGGGGGGVHHAQHPHHPHHKK